MNEAKDMIVETLINDKKLQLKYFVDCVNAETPELAFLKFRNLVKAIIAEEIKNAQQEGQAT